MKLSKKILIVSFLLLCNLIYSQEVKLRYGGYNFITEITEDNVNIRNKPTLKSKKIGKLYRGDKIRITGISKTAEEIDGHLGYWLRFNKIETSKDKKYISSPNKYNWVWSKYVAKLSNLKPSKISLKKHKAATSHNVSTIELFLEHNGKTRTIEAYAHKEDSQNHYTFLLSSDLENYMYYDVPGTYIYLPESNEIKHITYYGNGTEWNILSNDNKYLLQDAGSCAGPRFLSIINLESGEIVFDGLYMGCRLNLKGNEVDIIYVPNYLNEDKLDSETIRHAKEFKKNNKAEDDSYQVIVTYRYNFVTKKRKFVKCYYQVSQ